MRRRIASWWIDSRQNDCKSLKQPRLSRRHVRWIFKQETRYVPLLLPSSIKKFFCTMTRPIYCYRMHWKSDLWYSVARRRKSQTNISCQLPRKLQSGLVKSLKMEMNDWWISGNEPQLGQQFSLCQKEEICRLQLKFPEVTRNTHGWINRTSHMQNMN